MYQREIGLKLATKEIDYHDAGLRKMKMGIHISYPFQGRLIFWSDIFIIFFDDVEFDINEKEPLKSDTRCGGIGLGFAAKEKY